MTEESEDPESVATADADPAAMALALGGASRSAADAFLRKHGRLADAQIEVLHKYEVSHLRWRRFNDQMKGALQIMLVAVGAAIVVAIGAALWNASQAEGFVIEAFSVPPGYAQRGLSGDIVADDITGKIAQIRQFANDNSLSRSKEISKDRKNDVRVEIPETGISVSEAWRTLRGWLGDERHLTGSLRDNGDGRITLALGVPGAADVSVAGPAVDIDRLEARAAEQVFAGIDPVNYVQYLSAKGRHMEAMAAAKHFVSIAVGAPERADSYALWAYTTYDATGDFALAIARANIGIAIDPQLAATHVQLMNAEFDRGRFEETLRQAKFTLTLKESDQLARHRSGGFATMLERARTRTAAVLGDFFNADNSACVHICSYADQIMSQAVNAARLHDLAGSRNLVATATAAGSTDAVGPAEVRYYSDLQANNGHAAITDAKAVIAAFAQSNSDISARYVSTIEETRFIPQQATAEAYAGDFAQAHRLIDATPAGCYMCLVSRGLIDTQENRPDGAAYWYQRAIDEAPSIPFAYADWGAMLLRQGRLDNAIAKFTLANAKGPHFADPLEMWGEALMLKNRSDLALAKFEEADKFAPDWGRLHLEWGKALFYARKKDVARKQFALSASLELSATDKAALAKWMAKHE